MEWFSLYIRKIEISIQKIDNHRPETFGMVITSFLIDDRDEKSRFLEKTFLLVNISKILLLKCVFLP